MQMETILRTDNQSHQLETVSLESEKTQLIGSVALAAASEEHGALLELTTEQLSQVSSEPKDIHAENSQVLEPIQRLPDENHQEVAHHGFWRTLGIMRYLGVELAPEIFIFGVIASSWMRQEKALHSTTRK